jgi:hypothetical protein
MEKKKKKKKTLGEWTRGETVKGWGLLKNTARISFKQRHREKTSGSNCPGEMNFRQFLEAKGLGPKTGREISMALGLGTQPHVG